MKHALLGGRDIALSISDSPDLAVLGLGREHLDDAMMEIARHLIACGSSLSYGGDLREGGFTELLFEVVNRYRSNKEADMILVRNYLAYPVHITKPEDQLKSLEQALEGLANLVLLDPEGKEISLSERPAVRSELSPSEWIEGLTAMRTAMARRIHARVTLGGQISGYRGRLPGIAEEALIQLQRKAPLFVLGGFGGCSLDVARALDLDHRNIPLSRPNVPWPGIDAFAAFGPSDLHNGLTEAENRLLAETVHIDQAVALVLRGLTKLSGPKKRRPRTPR